MAESDASTTAFVERMPRHPLVWNNHSMAWISDLIAGIVENKAPRWWWISIAITSAVAGFRGLLHFLSAVHRGRSLGKQYSCRLGVGYYQLCLLDRYWPRRYLDLGDSASLPAKMADFD